ncbi:MAG: enoyl-CoA hydratase/isomerase family protein [Nocardiopsaceae bacterium]|nr:enoyl-CoA hydratase/isomerase family protein [Nocardiopsaceae bacterium]
MAEPLALVSGPDDLGTAVLTLNRPAKKNALSIALRERVDELIGRLARDQSVKALVIIGAGGTFCAGFDLGEFADPDPGHQQRLWASSDQFHHGIAAFPVPVVAAVDGVAYAGGFDLAVLCDLRIATPQARFGHPESAFAPVVYGPLHDLVGGSVARDLVLTGREIDAEAALSLRIVSEIVPRDALAGRAVELAHLASRAPRDVLIRTKAKFLARAGIQPGTPTLDL